MFIVVLIFLEIWILSPLPMSSNLDVLYVLKMAGVLLAVSILEAFTQQIDNLVLPLIFFKLFFLIV